MATPGLGTPIGCCGAAPGTWLTPGGTDAPQSPEVAAGWCCDQDVPCSTRGCRLGEADAAASQIPVISGVVRARWGGGGNRDEKSEAGETQERGGVSLGLGRTKWQWKHLQGGPGRSLGWVSGPQFLV